MIVNAASTQAVASLGWVHKGSLWVYKIGDASPRIHELSDAKCLTVKAGTNDFFSIVHHWDGDKVEISAHNQSEPHRPISSVSLQGADPVSASRSSTFLGGKSVWRELPRAYVAFAFGDYHLFLIEADGDISVHGFPWYSNTSYDKVYQGIVGVEEVPNSRLLIVSVQRDSNPILYDPEARAVVRKLVLANRFGNPAFKFRASANEFWATDYDHVVKLDATTLDVTASRRLQKGTRQVMRQFIGEFSFCRHESLCLVARPFGGDVIGLDCDKMRPTHRVSLGRQPLEAGLLGDDTVVALDWKTGEFLMGELRRSPLAFLKS